MATLDIPTSELISSLDSSTCPACAQEKRPRQAFCTSCHLRLPHTLRLDLENGASSPYQRGYAQSVADGMRFLGRGIFRLPGARRVEKAAVGLFGDRR